MAKTKKVYLILFVLLIITSLLSLTLGSEHINVFKAFWDIVNGRVNADTRILQYARFPRTLAGLLAGSALSLSGVITQSVLRNPLASPSTIGVNSGAGLMVVLFSALFPSLISFTPFASLLGAFLGALIVIGISERFSASRLSLVLSGVAVSAIFSAGIDTVLTFVPESLNGYSDFRIGGLFSVSLKDLSPSYILILLSMVISLILHNEMDILLLGMEEGRSLGVNTKRLRLFFLFLAAVMSGSAISFCGLIGFVGLIVPHIMRTVVGEESKPLMICSIMGGAILLTCSDLLSRVLFAPYELPVGIIMALLGGPFFIYLLSKRGRN